MPHKRKGDLCLNCSQPLAPDINFCPNCGQENDNRNVSIWALAADFIEETVGVDSKLLRSLVPFLLQPGKLTLSFINGQRKKYVPPLRMYLVLSVIYFLLFSNSVDNIRQRIEKDVQTDSTSSIKSGSRDTSTSGGIKAEIIFGTSGFSITSKDSIDGPEKIIVDRQDTAKSKTTMAALSSDTVTDIQIANQLKVDTSRFWLKAIKQGRRFTKDTKGTIGALISFASENASFAGFLMIPLLALFLKLIYIRRNIKYIAHVVHVLHLQSFLILLISINIAISFYLIKYTDADLDILVILLSFVYYVISTKRVYGQSWGKTILKNILYWIWFFVLLVIVVLMLLLISFMLF